MIYSINHFFTKVFDVILSPIRNVNDFWPILFLSILMSFFILFLLKYISFPKKIKNEKEKIKANIFAIRIYKDFWKVILSSFFKSLFHTLKYFMFNLAPFLIIIPLLTPIFTQMESRYGVRPFKPSEVVVVKADFKKNIKDAEIYLMKNEHFNPVMPPVFMDYYSKIKGVRIHQIDWKIKIIKNGVSTIDIIAFGKQFSKRIVIGDHKISLSDTKYDISGWGHILYPSESLFGENSDIRSVSISYPGKLITFMGIKMHWIIWNLIIMVILILVFKDRFGVEF